jgi:hypothetical protein
MSGPTIVTVAVSDGARVSRSSPSLRRVRQGVALAVALIAFPIAADAGFLDLEWSAPTTSADGSPLQDLAAYRVYAGTSAPACPGAAFQTLASPSSSPGAGTVVPATLVQLTPGATYWVQVTAVDTSGNESACTPAVSGVAHRDVAVAPTALSFGSVPVGTTRNLDFIFHNLDASPLTGTAVTTTPFSIVAGGSLNVAPGGSQVVSVGFTPIVAGVFAAGVTFTTSADPLVAAVSGTGATATPEPALIQFSQATYTVIEGQASTITVTRTGSTQSAVTVSYATTTGGTASAGVDYTARSGTLTFAPGATSATFSVGTARDKATEAPETITLTLSNPQGGAVLGTLTQALLTVTDRPRNGRHQR